MSFVIKDMPAQIEVSLLEKCQRVETVAITTRLLHRVGGSFNVPIRCGGAVVMPGDVVVADFSGVLSMPPLEAPQDLDWAMDKAASEPAMHRAMLAREKLGERCGENRIAADKGAG